MELNANFDKRVLIHSDDLDWLASPMPGVHRRMLDRIGAEVARATTIVRYAPGSSFSAHTHDGGEEFIVLEGVFQDEHGDYPAGTYVRNPPTSSHTPGSREGCIILVKLWQFDLADRNQFRKTMADELGLSIAGVATATLHKDAQETVTYAHLDANAVMTDPASGGLEMYVIAGSVEVGRDILVQGSWLRHPAGQSLDARAGSQGAKIWIKTGHLVDACAPVIAGG